MRANRFISGLIKFLLKYSIGIRFRTLGSKTQIGQGLIEYLLILVLTVTILSAVARGVGVPVVDYMKNKVFNMVGCMIRVGERYDIAFDKCGGTAALSLDLSELNSGQSSNSSANNSISDNSNQASTSNNRPNSNTNDRTGFRNSNSTGSVDGRSGSQDNNSGSEITNAKKRIKLNNEDSGGSNFSFNDGSSDELVLVRRIKVGKKIKNKTTLTTKKSKVLNEKNLNNLPNSKKIEDEESKGRRRISSFSIEKSKQDLEANTDTLDDEGFSFIKMAKWFLIIAIILMIGLFTLGQLNSIRKGWTD